MYSSTRDIFFKGNDHYFAQGARVASLVGGAIHAVMIIIAYQLEITELFIFNLFSATFYFGSFFILLKNSTQRKVSAFFWIVCIEVMLHATLAVLLLGIESGFALFIWLPAMLYSLRTNSNVFQKVLFSVIYGMIYLLLLIYSWNTLPIYQIDHGIVEVLSQVCIYCFSVAVVTIAIYFGAIIKRKEAIVLREIHHRILNKLQLVTSLNKIEQRNTDNQIFTDKIDIINERLYAISRVHQSVYFDMGAAMVDLERILSLIGKSFFPEGVEKKIVKEKNTHALGLDSAIPIGLVIYEVFKEISTSDLMEIDRITIQPNKEKRYTLSMEGLSKSHNGKMSSEMTDNRGDLVEILVEQLEGEYTFQVKEDKWEFQLHFEDI